MAPRRESSVRLCIRSPPTPYWSEIFVSGISNCVAYLLAMRLIARVNDLAFFGKRHGRCPSVQKDSGWQVENQWQRVDRVQIANHRRYTRELAGARTGSRRHRASALRSHDQRGRFAYLAHFGLARSAICLWPPTGHSNHPTSQAVVVGRLSRLEWRTSRRHYAARSHTWRTARCTNPGLPEPYARRRDGSILTFKIIPELYPDSAEIRRKCLPSAAEAILLDR